MHVVVADDEEKDGKHGRACTWGMEGDKFCYGVEDSDNAPTNQCGSIANFTKNSKRSEGLHETLTHQLDIRERQVRLSLTKICSDKIEQVVHAC